MDMESLNVHRKMDHLDINQNVDNTIKKRSFKDFNSVVSQHEALRKATLLKHRKVSTQLKLDMVQRQLSDLKRSGTNPDNDREFYRLQMQELSSELQDLDSTLDRVEMNAFYARRRLLRHCGMDLVSSSIPLSSSHPAIFTSTENLSRSTSRNSLKSKVCHLMSSPTSRFKKSHLFGELRAVASLSSLNVKSNSPTSSDEDHPTKDTKVWKAPLRFLGNLVDSRIRRKLWRSTKWTKSSENIVDEKKSRHLSDSDHSKDCNGLDNSAEDVFSSSSDSSSSSESEDDEVEEDWRPKTVPKYACRAPVLKKISSQQKAQIDPAILAEIEDFEKMAEQYIKQHS